jgi:intracellular multiplication protein IcmE
MASIMQNSPWARMFSGAGSAGPRRLAMLGGAAVVVLGGVGFVVMQSHHGPQQSTVAKAPDVDPLPGGMHSNTYYAQLATEQAQAAAQAAAAQGQSSVAPMPAGVPSQPVAAVPSPAAAPPTQHPVVRAISEPDTPPPAFAYRPVVAQQPPAAASRQPDEKQTQLYAGAIASLLAGWGGSKPPVTDVILPPGTPTSPEGGGATAVTSPGGVMPSTAATQGGDAGNAAAAPATVLISAGKGVYGRTKLASSSDQGGPVVVTAESGPIAGDDMIGTFEKRGDRLVVTLDSITLQDGEVRSIDALVIAPDSMETAVASSVDQHYVSRFVLPVAAAFVAGLGQAIQQSNATVAVSPFGGYTAQNHLNFDQELGVAAGAAGSQLQNLFLQNMPHGPTVKLAAGVNVGVIFLKPLTASMSP